MKYIFLHIIRHQQSFLTVIPDSKVDYPRVTHPCATRRESKSNFVQALYLHWAVSFDLHVLGMPPAFILSQDQTLNKFIFILVCSFFPSYSKLTFCLVFKDHLCCFSQRITNITNQIFYVNNFFNFFYLFLTHLLYINFTQLFQLPH